MSTRSRPAVLAVLATAMLLTSGIAGIAVAGSPSATDAQQTETPDCDGVIDSFVERISTLETAQFTRTVESTYDDDTTARTVSVAADLEDFQKRTETVSSSIGNNATTVLNESKSITYDADENTVTDYEVSGATLLPRIEALGNESRLDYEYLGSDTVEGQETHALAVTPERQSQLDSDVETSVTLHVDRETYFPVEIVSETVTEDTEFETTTTYGNVALDEEIPESTFELDVPEDATDPTENLGPEITSYESYGEFTDNAALSVPDAEITEEFSFEQGTIVDGENYYRVSLTYGDGDRTVTVNTRAEPAYGFDYSESDRYDSVEVGDTTGYISSSEGYTSLHWEADQSYDLYGQTSNETAVDIAASITDE